MVGTGEQEIVHREGGWLMGWKTVEEDSLSEKGAHALAKKIREYWFKRGIAADVWAERGSYEREGQNGPRFWVVRSNLNINGEGFV